MTVHNSSLLGCYSTMTVSHTEIMNLTKSNFNHIIWSKLHSFGHYKKLLKDIFGCVFIHMNKFTNGSNPSNTETTYLDDV